MAPNTIKSLHKMKKNGEKIAALTAYDASFACAMSNAGVELILVGDSVGNVVQGIKTTVPVQMDEMVYHTRCVINGNENAVVMSDLPFMSYANTEQAISNATKLMHAGAHMVKMEGGSWLCETVSALTTRGVPVCGHLGLTPQSVHALGGFRVQGRTPEAAQALFDDASALTQAGVACLVLECVPAGLASDISHSLNIPVIGVGAGNGTDGQILVCYDVLGISFGGYPKFAANFLKTCHSIEDAFTAYVKAVKLGEFPLPEHSFS